jgi:predicted transposase YbfD/YdcC
MFLEFFEEIKDPRRDQGKRHQLADVLALTICAVLSGADNWVEIEEYGQIKYEWLKTWLDLPHGIPSHDTLTDIFARIDAKELEACFQNWIESIVGKLKPEMIHIDGKTLRGSASNGEKGIHLVSAWVSEAKQLFGQVRSDAKSNEITAIPELLSLLEIQGALVTIDAMGTQTAIAQQIVEQKKADYLLALKGNQGTLLADVEDLFKGCDEVNFEAVPHDYAQTIEKGHGRIEIRRCWMLQDATYLHYVRRHGDWTKLSTLVRVQRERHIGENTSLETAYFISSRHANATYFLQAVRSHWTIENQLHWLLDVAFREDDNQTRLAQAQENFALIRRLALMLLNRDKSVKIGVKAKRLRVGWSDDYLFHVLSN